MGLVSPADWLVRVFAFGGLLLLLTRLGMMATTQPARRRRLGESGLLAALVLAVLSFGPAWLLLPAGESQPLGVDLRSDARAPETLAAPQREAGELRIVSQPDFSIPSRSDVQDHRANADADPSSAVSGVIGPVVLSATDVAARNTARACFALYLVGAAVVFGRWLLGHLALDRLLRRSRPAPRHVEQFAAELAGPHSNCRIRVSDRASVPFSCGVVRSTIILPAEFAERAPATVLRWVLGHELAHVENRDAWSALLASLAQIAYYPLPWLWSLCRQLRLCQEYSADAAAVAAGGNAADYAQFLLSWAAEPILPSGAAAVSGRPSELYRRITMLLQSPIALERRCPRPWTWLTAGVLLMLAVLGSALGRQAAAAPAPEPAAGTKKDDHSDANQKPEAKKKTPGPDAPSRPKETLDSALEELLRANVWNEEQRQLLKNLLEDHLRAAQEQIGAGRQQIQSRIGRLAEDPALKELVDERERVLRNLQGLVGRPVGFPLPPIRPVVPLIPDFGAAPASSRLGVSVSKPGSTLSEQLELPAGQGLIVEEVLPDTAAARAGLKAHDILLELAGKPVPNESTEFAKQLASLPSGKEIEAVVLRRGKRETLKGVKLSEVKAPPARPGGTFNALPDFAHVPGGFGVGLPAFRGFGADANMPPPQGGVITTTFRTDDHFTTRHEEGSLVITLTGTVDKGSAKVTEIQVQDGRESHTYGAPDKVPEAYRDKVKHLADLLEKDNVRIRIEGIDGIKPAPQK